MKKTKMLKKNYEFREVLSKGTLFHENFLKAYIVRNNKNYNTIGLAVSTKIRQSSKKE